MKANTDDDKAESVGDSRGLTSLKIDCLLNGADAASQKIQTFREMKETDFRLMSETDGADGFSKAEVKSVLEAFDERVDLAKEAYMLSKCLIDPNLRVRVTFEFAMVSILV